MHMKVKNSNDKISDSFLFLFSGTCTEKACKPGFWDDNCETACSPYCATNPASGEQECNYKNGFCTHGCTYNTHGDTCLQPCNPNCYDNRTDAAIQANGELFYS